MRDAATVTVRAIDELRTSTHADAADWRVPAQANGAGPCESTQAQIAGLRDAFVELRAERKADFAALRAELREELAAFRSETELH
ncbi:MAG TPA: hypothetical protein VL689_05810 [Paraburkholderia sp.]|jgi:hypothetical protein|nr:hypothetical protein [Paraburkholderia sp.]